MVGEVDECFARRLADYPPELDCPRAFVDGNYAQDLASWKTTNISNKDVSVACLSFCHAT